MPVEVRLLATVAVSALEVFVGVSVAPGAETATVPVTLIAGPVDNDVAGGSVTVMVCGAEVPVSPAVVLVAVTVNVFTG